MNVEELGDDLQLLDSAAASFWHSEGGRSLTLEEREDVLQTARLLRFRYPYDPTRKGPTGKTVNRESYLRRLIPTALHVWRSNEKIRADAFSQLQVEATDEAQKEEMLINLVPDPLSISNPRSVNRGAVLLDEFGTEELLQPAPYKVRFLENTSALIYRQHPFHVPRFRIDPKYKDELGREIIAVGQHGKQKGKRRRFTSEHLTKAITEQLEDRRCRLGQYISELIPHYLRHFGFVSLERRHWAIIADINKKGYSPSQIQQKRRMSANTYNALIRTLTRRGWLKTWCDEKQREVLRYYPAYDRCKTLYNSMILDLEQMSVREVIELAGPILGDQLYSEESSESTIHKQLRLVRDQMRDAVRDVRTEEEYDAKLRLFILDFIGQPVRTGMPIRKLEERFAELTLEQRRTIFFEALRLRKSLFDVIADDFSATFADVLKPREEAKRKETETTLATLLLAITSHAKGLA